MRRLFSQGLRLARPHTTMSTGNFIVVFKSHATQDQINQYADQISTTGGEIGHRYDTVLKGFSAKLTPQHLTSFQADDIIDYIEPDGIVTTQ